MSFYFKFSAIHYGGFKKNCIILNNLCIFCLLSFFRSENCKSNKLFIKTDSNINKCYDIQGAMPGLKSIYKFRLKLYVL